VLRQVREWELLVTEAERREAALAQAEMMGIVSHQEAHFVRLHLAGQLLLADPGDEAEAARIMELAQRQSPPHLRIVGVSLTSRSIR
jgi:hypothetical protein